MRIRLCDRRREKARLGRREERVVRGRWLDWPQRRVSGNGGDGSVVARGSRRGGRVGRDGRVRVARVVAVRRRILRSGAIERREGVEMALWGVVLWS